MDSTIASRTEMAPALASEELIDVRLTSIHYAAPDTNLFEFNRIDGMPLAAYEPGARIDLHLPGALVRQYLLILAKPDPSTQTAAIKCDPASREGSRYIHDKLHVGNAIKISPPRNNFPLKDNVRHVVLFASDIGITPICRIVQGSPIGTLWQLYYSSRSRADMTFVKTLERMAGATLHSMMRLAQFLDIAALVAVAPKDAHLLLRSDAHARGVRRCDREVAERKDSPRTFHTKCEPTKGGGFTVELARSKQGIPWVPPRPSSRAQATSVQEATPMPRIPR